MHMKHEFLQFNTLGSSSSSFWPFALKTLIDPDRKNTLKVAISRKKLVLKCEMNAFGLYYLIFHHSLCHEDGFMSYHFLHFLQPLSHE